MYNNLEPSERETVIGITDVDDMYDVYTCQTKMLNTLKRIGAIPVADKIQRDTDGKIISGSYKLDPRQIIFRKIPEVSEETTEKRKLQGKKMADERARKRQLETQIDDRDNKIEY